jgi:hypothetical protein
MNERGTLSRSVHPARRELIRVLCMSGVTAAGAWLLTRPSRATAAENLAERPRPPEVPAPLSRQGSGRFRRFGFHVYDATLWAAAPALTSPPLALELVYRRTIRGRDIAQASVDEMRRLGVPESRLAEWGLRMQSLFPDVRDGDRIVGLHEPDTARFWFNGRVLGSIDDAAFARGFFGIWLDPRTSAPELRTALLTPAPRPARE